MLDSAYLENLQWLHTPGKITEHAGHAPASCPDSSREGETFLLPGNSRLDMWTDMHEYLWVSRQENKTKCVLGAHANRKSLFSIIALASEFACSLASLFLRDCKLSY